MDAAEMIGMEQMPGGRVQVMVRSGGGAQYYLTPVLQNIFVGQVALEAYRSRLGGEEPMYPVPSFLPGGMSLETATFVDETDATDANPNSDGETTESSELSDGDFYLNLSASVTPGQLDRGTLRPLTFSRRNSVRRARPRHPRIPRRSVRVRQYQARLAARDYALSS